MAGPDPSQRSGPPAARPGEIDLGELVYRRRVVWEVRPAIDVVGPDLGERVQNGYLLDLFGLCQFADRVPKAGSIEGRQVYGDLYRLALVLLPPKPRASRFAIETFDGAFHLTPQRSFREEVLLTIHILRRSPWYGPVGPQETEYLHRMEAALERLGARRG